ncbi:hypothetical protein ACFE04_005151 [Oxalis oulophora]
MPPLKNIFCSSSSSSSSSNNTNTTSSLPASPSNQQQSPRLTRQRKLRHVTRCHLGLHCVDLDNPSAESSSSSSYHHQSFSYSAAVPQPLPQPDMILTRRLQSTHDDDDRLFAFAPSTTTTQARNLSELQRRLSEDLNFGIANNNSLNLTVPTRNHHFTSLGVNPQRSKSAIAKKTSAPLCSSPSRFFPELAEESARMPKSAPTSNLSSPTVSPRKSSAGGSPSRFPFLFQTKSLHENSVDWQDKSSFANAHPLPLPPRGLPHNQSCMPSPLPSPAVERPILSPVRGQWKKGKLIGRGTFGSVYVATNRDTGALCAMKEVDVIPDDPKSAECIKQLEQEIKVLRHLKHPNIVQYYGSEMVDDRFCIYLEYIHPGSFNKYVREHCGAITESIVRNFTRHILTGLAFLHNKKTIHRDIKGANLLVDVHGVVKLADFGMAKHLTGLSYNLSLKGSPYWMAPEVMQAVMQKNTSSDLALAVDIWSLGCTVIEMLTGKPPWGELEGPQAMFKVLHKSPPIPEALSSEGKDFLHLCFQRNPADRPSAALLLEHQFMQNISDQHLSVCTQELSKINLADESQNPRNCTTPKRDSMTGSPVTSTMNRKLLRHRSSDLPFS